MSRLSLKSIEVKNFESCGLDYYWKVLSKFDLTSMHCDVFPNGVIVSLGDDIRVNGIYNGKSLFPVISNVSFVQYLESGYMLIGTGYDEECEIGLFSPCGRLMGIYAFDKNMYSRVSMSKTKDGYKRFTTGFTLFNSFFFKYNTLAIKCANKCYLARPHKLDLAKLFCVGFYNDIKSMEDNECGLVAVHFHNGRARLLNKDFSEINIMDGLSKVIFLENGDFFAFDNKGTISLFNKKLKFIKNVNSVEVEPYSRLYKLGDGKKYDCYTHEVYTKLTVPLCCVDGYTIHGVQGLLTCAYNDKFDFVVANRYKGKPRFINNKFMLISDGKQLFMIDPFIHIDSMDSIIASYLFKLPDDEDLSLELFLYFKNKLEGRHVKKYPLKKMLEKSISSLI